jgi:YcaO-like protein with predicted kinase domain
MTLPVFDSKKADIREKVVVVGTHRTCLPAETLRRIRPFFAEMGITRVANVTGMDHLGIPTVMVVRPNSRSLSVSQGKGVDLDSARASGVMEAVEQWHAERVTNPLVLASFADLPREQGVVSVAGLPRSVRPWDPFLRTLWIAGDDLIAGRPRLVPYEMVHLDLRLPLPEASGCFPIGSNGLASGNTRLEATLHGLWELIERDATTLFLRRTAAAQWARRIDLDSVGDETCRGLLDRFERAAIDVAVWDTTTDVGLPSFLCAVVERSFDPFRPVGMARGMGCHNDAAVALSRALTEAAQSRLTRIVGSRDDISSEEVARLQSEEENARHRAQVRAPARPPRRFDEVPSASLPSFEADLRLALERLARLGLEQVVVVDLSRPTYPVHVVRVVVPGLEAISEMPGYVPGPRASAHTAGPSS